MIEFIILYTVPSRRTVKELIRKKIIKFSLGPARFSYC